MTETEEASKPRLDSDTTKSKTYKTKEILSFFLWISDFEQSKYIFPFNYFMPLQTGDKTLIVEGN